MWQCGLQSRKNVCGQARFTEPYIRQFTVHLARSFIDQNQFSPGSNWCFSFAPELVGYSAPRDLHRRAAYSIRESWVLIYQDVYLD